MKINSRILLSTLSIVLSLSLVTGGAFAAFTSTATNAGNTFGAGTLTLLLNSTSNVSQTTPLFNVANATPGMDPVIEPITLSNTGSINASTVNFSVTTTNLNPAGVSGNLGGQLTLSIYNDANNNGQVDPGEQIGTTQPLNAWAGTQLGSLAAEATEHLLAVINFPSSGVDNTFQGASEGFSLSFLASQ